MNGLWKNLSITLDSIKWHIRAYGKRNCLKNSATSKRGASPLRGRKSPPRGRKSPLRGRKSPPRGRKSPPRGARAGQTNECPRNENPRRTLQNIAPVRDEKAWMEAGGFPSAISERGNHTIDGPVRSINVNRFLFSEKRKKEQSLPNLTIVAPRRFF